MSDCNIEIKKRLAASTIFGSNVHLSFCYYGFESEKILEKIDPEQEGKVQMGFLPQRTLPGTPLYEKAIEEKKAKKTGNRYTIFYSEGPKQFDEYCLNGRYFILADSDKSDCPDKIPVAIEPIEWEINPGLNSLRGELQCLYRKPTKEEPYVNYGGTFQANIPLALKQQKALLKTIKDEMFQEHDTKKETMYDAFVRDYNPKSIADQSSLKNSSRCRCCSGQ